jgi:predicted nucleic-acid-binding protein
LTRTSSFVTWRVTHRTWPNEPLDVLLRNVAFYLAYLVVAETVYVLESFYEAPRSQVADAIRSLIAFDSIVCVDPALLLGAIEIYETDRLEFAEAYLIACAESTEVRRVASLDRAIDRVDTVERVEPPRI